MIMIKVCDMIWVESRHHTCVPFAEMKRRHSTDQSGRYTASEMEEAYYIIKAWRLVVQMHDGIYNIMQKDIN